MDLKRMILLLLVVLMMGCVVIPAQAKIVYHKDGFDGTQYIYSKSGPIGDFDALEYYKAPGDGSFGIDMVYCLDVFSDNAIFSTGYLKIDGVIYTLQSNLGSAFDLKVSNRYFPDDHLNRIISRARTIIIRVGNYTEQIPDDIVAEWRKVAAYQFQ